MAIMLNGKKVVKIMLNGKEIMSAGTDINEYFKSFRPNTDIGDMSGTLIDSTLSTVYPDIEVPNGAKKVVITRVLNGISKYTSAKMCFLDSNKKGIGWNPNVNLPFLIRNQYKTVKPSIPSGTKFIRFQINDGFALIDFE